MHFLQNHGLIIGHHGNKNERPVLSINMNSAHGVKCDPNLKHMQLIFKRAVFDFRRQHTRNGVF